MRVLLRGAEPVVVAAGVVERDVADDLDAAPVGLGGERDERLVAAERGVDAVEGDGVVAVVGATLWRQLEGHGGQARDYLFTPELVARESTGRAPG